MSDEDEELPKASESSETMNITYKLPKKRRRMSLLTLVHCAVNVCKNTHLFSKKKKNCCLVPSAKNSSAQNTMRMCIFVISINFSFHPLHLTALQSRYMQKIEKNKNFFNVIRGLKNVI